MRIGRLASAATMTLALDNSGRVLYWERLN
jgi:hypothetical protein